MRSFITRASCLWRKAALAIGAALFLAASGCDSRSAEVPTSNPPIAKHALIVSIDGCRPDMLLRANAPTIRGLMKQGSFTFWARTTAVSITLPSHTSMLTGVTPEVHGITWNDAKDEPIIYPNVPTIFDIAKAKGLTTAVFSGKAKFNTFTRPGVVDWSYVVTRNLEGWIDDDRIAAAAAKAIREHRPNVTLVHLGAVDRLGHKSYRYLDEDKQQGWGTNEQLWGIERADACVGELVRALEDTGMYQDTLIIISADHGGAGSSHGPNDFRSRHIPWICVGPGVRKDYDLTRVRSLTVRTEDTFATASYFLGLPIDPDIQGRPVMQVFPPPDQELLINTK